MEYVYKCSNPKYRVAHQCDRYLCMTKQFQRVKLQASRSSAHSLAYSRHSRYTYTVSSSACVRKVSRCTNLPYQQCVLLFFSIAFQLSQFFEVAYPHSLVLYRYQQQGHLSYLQPPASRTSAQRNKRRCCISPNKKTRAGYSAA